VLFGMGNSGMADQAGLGGNWKGKILGGELRLCVRGETVVGEYKGVKTNKRGSTDGDRTIFFQRRSLCCRVRVKQLMLCRCFDR